MKTAKDWVNLINSKNLTTPHDVENIEGSKELKQVAIIDRDEHRWYTIGTVVFMVGNEFLGVRGAIDRKSEDMSWDDLGMKCSAFEMEAIPSVTYKMKETKI